MTLPNSVFHTRWDLLIVLLVLYNVITMPIEIGMEVDMSQTDILSYLDYIIDGFFLTDMLINFVTPLKNDRGEINVNPRDIAKNYLTKWFFIDVLASLPLEVVTFIIPGWHLSLIVH